MFFRKSVLAAAAAVFLALPVSAQAEEAPGTFYVRLRALNVIPDVSSHVSSSDAMVDITNSTVPEADLSYFLTKHWAVEVIAGTTKHSISLKDGTYLGSAFLLPPTVTLQYHFDQMGPFKPYLGAGPQYTWFYDTSADGALGKMHLTDGFGFTLQAGVDIPLGFDNTFLNIDVKKMFMQTTASFDGAVTGHVNINPWLLGAGVGIRF